MCEFVVEYKEIDGSFSDTFDTYIIAFCPDTADFFVTNQRYFFWEYEKEFPSEEDGIRYFEENVEYFRGIHDKILSDMFIFPTHDNRVFLDNTKKFY